MRRFKPITGVILGLAFQAALGLGMAALASVVPWVGAGMPARTPILLYGVLADGILMLGVFGVAWLLAAWSASAVFEVDEVGIRRRMPFSEQWLAWSAITRFELAGLQQNVMTLWDGHGGTLEVDTGVLMDGAELLALLTDRTAVLRDAMLRDWRASGAALRARIPLGSAIAMWAATLAPFGLFAAWAFLQLPGDGAGSHVGRIAGCAFCLVAAITMPMTAIEVATRTLWISPTGIAVGSAIGRRRIAFADITSIETREMAVNGATISTTTVRAGDGLKVAITSHFPNYADVVAYVKERAGAPEEPDRGEQITEENRRTARQAAVLIATVWPAVTLLLVGGPITMLQDRHAAPWGVWFFETIGVAGSGALLYTLVKIRMKALGTWTDPAVPEPVWLDASRIASIRRELQIIGIARCGGLKLYAWTLCFLMAAGAVLLIITLSIPALRAAFTTPNEPQWLRVSFYGLVFLSASGVFVLTPLGETYAYLRTRAIEHELADPRLASDLVVALERSGATDRALNGEASMRLLNALTAILRGAVPPELAPAQRRFLCECLARWQNDPERAGFCVALLSAIAAWGDAAGAQVARTSARTANTRQIRDAAMRASQMVGDAVSPSASRGQCAG